MRDLSELIDEYTNQERMTRFEGESGVQNLCRLVHAIGYKDSMNFGQFHPEGCYGDLIQFLADNPGCMEAIVNWIGDTNISEWRQELEAKVPEESEDPDAE